jgi:hypothetical protein
MRAREFIYKEAIDINQPPADVKWSMDTDVDDGKPVHVASFKDPKGQTVNSYFKPDDAGRSASVLFDRPNEYGRPTFDKTGRGDASHVFQGAVSNIKSFLDANPNIQSVNFNSLDPTRSVLYSRMVDRHAPEAGLVGSASVRDPRAGHVTDFTLSRAQQDQVHQPIYNQVRDRLEPKLQIDREMNRAQQARMTQAERDWEVRRQQLLNAPPGSGVNLTRPPRARTAPAPTPTPAPKVNAVPFAPTMGGGRNMHDANPFKIPFSENKRT